MNQPKFKQIEDLNEKFRWNNLAHDRVFDYFRFVDSVKFSLIYEYR